MQQRLIETLVLLALLHILCDQKIKFIEFKLNLHCN